MKLTRKEPKKIIVYSRDEMKQWHMEKHFSKDPRVTFAIGDVRDSERLRTVMRNVDVVVHAAATKIVPIAETDPFECVKTNINGAMNIINVATDLNIKKVVVLSTDKACDPVSLYGTTKLISDKLFVSSNNPNGSGETRFAVVRYGNVINSRGSVVPFLKSLPENDSFPITDARMTRFMMTLEEGVDFVWMALDQMVGGEIFVRKCGSANILDIAAAINPNFKHHITGIRSGERLHEKMIGGGEINDTYEFEKYFVILPTYHKKSDVFQKYIGGKQVKESFNYNSDTNPHFFSVSELKSLFHDINIKDYQ
jgi:FlaA1/EpsC-like NDP-sugar epimerase